MSSAEARLELLNFGLVDLESPEDVAKESLGTNYIKLCSNEVTQAYASSLYKSESNNLKAVKLVKKGEKKAIALIMYVDPMRRYDKNDIIAKEFEKNAERLGFDQSNASEAIEIVAFCVEKGFKNKNLGLLLLRHAVEKSGKKFIVIGQDLGPASGEASLFFEKIFGNNSFETKRNKGNVRFYVAQSKNLLAKLDEKEDAIAKPATKPSKKSVAKKTVRAKKTTPAAVQKVVPVAKKRRHAAVCGKLVHRSDSFLNSVGKIFKESNKEIKTTLSTKAACIIDAILRETLEKIGQVSNSLLKSKGSKTMDQRTAKFAIESVFKNNNLAKHMIVHGMKALTNTFENKDKKVSRTTRAKLQIAPARVARLLRKARVASRFQENVDVFIAGALENLAYDIIENSLDLIGQSKKKPIRLNPRVLKLTISGDEELNQFFRGIIGGGGVMPSKEFEKKQKKQ